jgi:hypothetical protein
MLMTAYWNRISSEMLEQYVAQRLGAGWTPSPEFLGKNQD